MLDVNINSFQKEVLDYEGVVLVDFWAPWCGPCKMFMPMLQNFADKSPEVKVCKVNIEEPGNSELLDKYGVMSVPTLKTFKNGEEVDTSVGVIPEAALNALVEKFT